MNPAEKLRAQFCTWAIAAIAFYWTTAIFPRPASLLADHGHGYQLAGASEILAGRHPFLDFQDIYGPLTFYASAAAQRLAGERVIGELVLIAAAVAFAYARLFRLMVGIGIGWKIALTMTLVAITVQPAGYRYYLLVCPVIFFSAAWWYVDRPGWIRLAVMAAGVTFAGLFRPDMGVYTFVAGIAIVTLTSERRPVRGTLVAFAGLVILWAAPWLLWLALHGKWAAYFWNSSAGAIALAGSLSRPAASLEFSEGIFTLQNAKTALFCAPWLILIFSLIVMAGRRAELRGPHGARVCGVALYAALSLLQASHIVDWIHVRDPLPGLIFLLAWIVSRDAAERSRPAFARFLSTGLVAIICAGLVVGGLAKVNADAFRPGAVLAKLSVYGCTRDEFLAGIRQRGESFRAELYEYVRDHSRPDQAVFAVVESPQLNYFTDRRLAGDQLAILPGYFARPQDQRRLIARIRQEKTAFVVVNAFDIGEEYPGVTLDRFAPEFYAFLDTDFEVAAQFGYCRVLRPRWTSVPAGAAK